MNEIYRVIPRKNLPTTFPMYGTMIAALLLDRFNAAGWVWGVVGTLYTILWVVCIARIIKEREFKIDPLERG